MEHDGLSYEELKRRLRNAESALRAIRDRHACAFECDYETLAERLAEAEAREDHIKKVLMAIRNVNQLIVAENDRKRLIEKACDNLIGTLGYFNAWIVLLDENRRAVTMTASSGFDGAFGAMGDWLERGGFSDCMEKTLVGKELAVVEDPVSRCPDCPLSSQYAGRAGLTHLLEFEGRIYGVLSVSVPAEFATDAEEQSLFVEIANDLGFALHKIAAEKRIRLQNHIIKTIPQPMSFVSPDYRYLAVNDAYSQFFGVSPERIVGRLVVDFCGREVFEREIKPNMDRCLAGESVSYEVCVDFPRFGPRRMAMEYFAYRDESGVVVGIVSHGADITERKRAEEALRESEKFLRQVVDTSPSCIFVKDGCGRYLLVNRAIANLYGVPQEAMLGLTDADLAGKGSLGREEALRFLADDMEVMQRRRSKSISEELFTTADGGQRWFQTVKVPISSGAMPDCMLGVATDITERRNAEDELRRREEMLARTERIAQLGSWEWDVSADRVKWSDELFRIMGMDPAGTAPSFEEQSQLYHPEDMKRLRDAVEAAVDRGAPYELELRAIRKDGETRVCLARGRAEMGPDNSARFLRGSLQDMTEQKNAERKIRESERLLNFAIKQMPVPVVVAKSPDVKITHFNEGACNLLAKEQADVKAISLEAHREFWPTFHPDGTPYRVEDLPLTRAILRGETTENEEIVVRKKDGDCWISASAAPLRDEQGRIVAGVVAFPDITARKRAEAEKARLEEQFRQAQKMESIGRLAGGVAHDYNNMLSVISGYAEMAIEKTDSGDPAHEDLREILNAARRSAEITRQLLAFARKQTISPEVLDLNETVESMLKMLRRLIGEDIDLYWQPGTGLWQVSMDPSQIGQIMANLCINARDAIGGVGKITIETENVGFDEAYSADHPGFASGDFVLLAVSDNGCGMDSETTEKIFEPFFTTKDVGEGTGLGLATVYGIVKQNEGFVNVYSELEKGTTFRIYFPRHARETGRSEAQVAPPTPTGSGETVLIVEDEPSILKLAKRMLERQGYAVLEASTPMRALSLAEAHKGEIHLLITDVVMPEMNGRDLAVRLQSSFPELKILYMSGYTANVIAHRGVLESGVHFMQKPFSKKELAVKVFETLNS